MLGYVGSERVGPRTTQAPERRLRDANASNLTTATGNNHNGIKQLGRGCGRVRNSSGQGQAVAKDTSSRLAQVTLHL